MLGAVGFLQGGGRGGWPGSQPHCHLAPQESQKRSRPAGSDTCQHVWKSARQILSLRGCAGCRRVSAPISTYSATRGGGGAARRLQRTRCLPPTWPRPLCGACRWEGLSKNMGRAPCAAGMVQAAVDALIVSCRKQSASSDPEVAGAGAGARKRNRTAVRGTRIVPALHGGRC
jgi:hypothetical protein